MAKYLLTCACGRQHTLETRQAGELLTCGCGTTVAVPTLRQLCQLPEARAESASATQTTWGFRQGAITLSLLLAALCLALAAMSRYSEQPVPTLDVAKYAKDIDRLVSNLTPLEGWQRWIDTYQPLTTTGFEVYRPRNADAMQKNLDWHHVIEIAMLAAAAVCVAVAAAVCFTGRSDVKN